MWTRRLARASHFTRREITLHLAALYHLGRIGYALSRKPLNLVLTDLRRATGRTRAKPPGVFSPPAICAAVERTATVFMRNYTCLPQALAGYVLCARRGYHVDLRVGVGSPQKNRFAAHAWLEYEGSVILGEMPGLADLTVIARAGELLK